MTKIKISETVERLSRIAEDLGGSESEDGMFLLGLADECERTSEVEYLANAMWQMLDDMQDGCSVCLSAKADARLAIEPFLTPEGRPTNDAWMTFEEAQKIKRSCRYHVMSSTEYQPRTADRIIGILRALDQNPRSWQSETIAELTRQRAEIERLRAERDGLLSWQRARLETDRIVDADVNRLRALLDAALYSIATDSYEDQLTVAADINAALASQQPSDPVTDAMVERALDAWFKSPPSESDQGLTRSMRAALIAANAFQQTAPETK